MSSRWRVLAGVLCYWVGQELAVPPQPSTSQREPATIREAMQASAPRPEPSGRISRLENKPLEALGLNELLTLQESRDEARSRDLSARYTRSWQPREFWKHELQRLDQEFWSILGGADQWWFGELELDSNFRGTLVLRICGFRNEDRKESCGVSTDRPERPIEVHWNLDLFLRDAQGKLTNEGASGPAGVGDLARREGRYWIVHKSPRLGQLGIEWLVLQIPGPGYSGQGCELGRRDSKGQDSWERRELSWREGSPDEYRELRIEARRADQSPLGKPGL